MRRKAASVVVPAAFLLAVTLAGCGPQNPPPPVESGSPPSPTATAAPSVAETATDSPLILPAPTATTPQQTTAALPTAAPITAAPAPIPTDRAAADWITFRTSDGLAFDLPLTWTVLNPAGDLAEGGGTFAEVRNEARKVLATLRTNMATGSTCMEKYPYSVLDSQELPALEQGGVTPRFIFETRGDGVQPGPADTPAAAYGITSSPLPEGDTTCAMFQFFTWPPNAASFGAFYSPENNQTPGNQSRPYLELAKSYAETAEYENIRRMITSLRPVG